MQKIRIPYIYIQIAACGHAPMDTDFGLWLQTMYIAREICRWYLCAVNASTARGCKKYLSRVHKLAQLWDKSHQDDYMREVINTIDPVRIDGLTMYVPDAQHAATLLRQRYPGIICNLYYDGKWTTS